jgi:hypothetical protein
MDLITETHLQSRAAHIANELQVKNPWKIEWHHTRGQEALGLYHADRYYGTHEISVHEAVAANAAVTDLVIYHEFVHAKQMERMGRKLFFSRYVGEKVFAEITKSGYQWKRFPMEREAWERSVRYMREKGIRASNHEWLDMLMELLWGYIANFENGWIIWCQAEDGRWLRIGE